MFCFKMVALFLKPCLLASRQRHAVNQSLQCLNLQPTASLLPWLSRHAEALAKPGVNIRNKITVDTPLVRCLLSDLAGWSAGWSYAGWH